MNLHSWLRDTKFHFPGSAAPEGRLFMEKGECTEIKTAGSKEVEVQCSMSNECYMKRLVTSSDKILSC